MSDQADQMAPDASPGAVSKKSGGRRVNNMPMYILAAALGAFLLVMMLVAARIVRDHFDLLARRRIPDLARKLGASPDDVQSAIEEVGKLDPAPGRRFSEDTNRVVA